MNRLNNKVQTFFIYAALIAVTTAVFWQVHSHEFLNYDDNEYVTENSNVTTGLTLENIRWAFTATVSNHWHPLVWLSHMLDCQLFGLKPGPHHLVSMFLHIANTILLFTLLTLATRIVWPSAFVAALFALHPLHVESVAWAAERKDVLSTFFGLLALIFYVEYVKNRPQTSDTRPQTRKDLKSEVSGLMSRVWYAACLAAYALSLMSKPMLVTMPVVLLLLDYWPLRRLQPSSSLDQGRGYGGQALRLVIEKIPFFLLAVLSSAVTIIVMKHAGHVAGTVMLTPKYRIANTLVAYGMYILKMFWPAGLSPFYPHPGTTLPMWKAYVCGIVLLAVTAGVIFFKNRRFLTVGWLWYLITALPVIGILQVGSQAMADRYTYIPLIGLFIMVSFGSAQLAAGWAKGRYLAAAAGVIVVTVLAVCTYRQVGFWRDSAALFEHAIKVTDGNYLAYNNLANAMGQKGDYDAAIKYGLEALRIRSEYDTAHYNLGMAYYSKGNMDAAIEQWTKALKANLKYKEVNYAIAAALLKKGDTAAAKKYLQAELRLDPAHSGAKKLLLQIQTAGQP